MSEISLIRRVARAALVSILPFIATSAMAQTPPPTGGDKKPLEGTYWRATELGGKPAPKQDPQREAHLRFQKGRVSGSDGCNRVTGGYQLKGDRVTFTQIAATQMACLTSSGTEEPFHNALKNGYRLAITGDQLELFDRAGTRLAKFGAGTDPAASTAAPGSTPASSSKGASPLAGTSWQLVKFQSMDDTTLTPKAGAKYTIEFADGGQLFAQIDCNRGRGTWKSPGPSQIEFGPLALTRAQCPAGSMHDQIVRQWGNIRSYVIRDGHLFLAIKLDSGIYEFEPIAKGK